MNTLVYKAVNTPEEAETLRRIRNECRNFMTRNTDEITKEQQQEWFKTAHKKYDLFIAYEVLHGAVVIDAGYGLIHKNEDASLLTGGLLPSHRDRGLGKELFQFLINNCPIDKPILLEVLNSNVRAFKTYEKLGFVVTGVDEKLTYMEYKDGFDPVI